MKKLAFLIGPVFCVSILSSADMGAQETGTFWAPWKAPTVHYTIEGSIKANSGLELEFAESIEFTNSTGKPIQRLALNGIYGCEHVPQITAKGHDLEIVSRDESGKILSPISLTFMPPVKANKAVHLDIKSSCRENGVPDEDISQQWYPKIWWGYPTGDTYDVKITPPEGFVLVTSGRPGSKTGWSHQEHVRDFGLFLARNVQVKEAEAGDVLVRVVYRPKGAECAQLLSTTAVDVINFYRKRFGFFPYRSLTIIPGSADPVGGYPVSSAIVAIHGEETFDPKNDDTHWRWITSHEIGHQYWSEYVLSPGPDSLGWLMVGLGLYTDREYARAHGILHQHRNMMNGYIDGVRQGYDTTAARTPEQEDAIDWDYNNIVIHDKGLSIISALQTVIGKDAFDRAYSRALKEFVSRPMSSEDFERLCEQESNQDLRWFFDQWVRSDRFLAYQISSQDCQNENGKYQCQVKVKSLGTLQMPVPVSADFEDGTSQVRSTDMWTDVSVLKFQSKSPLKSARLDPDDDLAMVVPPPSMTRAKLSDAIDQLDKTGVETDALNLFRQAREMSGVSQSAWLKVGLALYQGEHYAEAMEALTRGEQTTNGGPGLWRFACLAWQGAIFDLQNRRNEALERYQLSLELLRQNPWLKVKIDKYGILIDRAFVEERLKTPFQRK